MEQNELAYLIDNLRNLTAETEVVEFKEAKNGYDFVKLGQYFSALSNEANLKNKKVAWLVFGIEDKQHDIVGSHFRPHRNDLDSLKQEIANHTTDRITFVEIHEAEFDKKRVVLFQIPAAPKGLPVAFKGHYYGRDGESLVPLNIEKIERIRTQVVIDDWSVAIVEGATLADLDETAIAQARENYKNKFPGKAGDVDDWDDKTFLDKAKITIKGKITRTAILLLGKEESEHYLVSADAKIRWILKTLDNQNKDYEIFSIPFLLAVDKVFGKIRNLKYRYFPDGTLFPNEVLRYEPFVIRESLNNAIAHQDYSKAGRINVVEVEDDHLIFTNLGSFMPGSVENVIDNNAPEEHYRNKFLATAMFNLNLVDTIGSGIIKMFLNQKNKFFPLPDYDVSDEKVKVTITGKILDMDYARLLAQNPDLSLDDIIMLDKVQKNKKLTDLEEKSLKSKNLIEGRKPNYYVSKKIAQLTGKKAEYSRNKAFHKQYYLDLIIKSITEFEYQSRCDINDLLWTKLPDKLGDNQKRNKISNLLAELRKKGLITNKGTLSKPLWVLIKPV